MSKVLVIEDDLAYRKIYQRKFEVSGYQVEVAEDGQAGLQKMQDFKPDIVFVDLMMPKMDGFQLIDRVKADPALKDIPIVVLTNLSTTEDAQKVISKGAVAILVKSDTDPNDIVVKAGQILGGQTPAAAPPPASGPAPTTGAQPPASPTPPAPSSPLN